MSEFFNNMTNYQLAALIVAFLLVGVPMLAFVFERIGQWLYEKMRRW